MLPNGVQGLGVSPKAETNYDLPPKGKWMSDPMERALSPNPWLLLECRNPADVLKD